MKKCLTIAIITALWVVAALSQPTEYENPTVMITNTNDFGWSKVEKVMRVYREPTHTTVLGLDRKPVEYRPPFIITELTPKEIERILKDELQSQKDSE